MLRVVGHRGFGILEPENSLIAFEALCKLQDEQQGFFSSSEVCFGIETDLWITRDNQIALIHGAGGKHMGPDLSDEIIISDLSFAELRDLPWPHGKGQQISNLQDLLELVHGNYKERGFQKPSVHLTLELKNSKAMEWVKEANVRLLLSTLEAYGALQHPDLITVSSFDHACLRVVRLLAPLSLMLACLFNDYEEPFPENFAVYTRDLGAVEAHGRFSQVTPAIVAKAAASGVSLMVWFPGSHEESVEELTNFLNMGVNSLCVNHPPKLVEVLKARQSPDKNIL